jgi:7-cyano-7-deazaguanine synthase
MMTTSAPPAVVLLSGGLDSATTLYIARREGFLVHALSIDYGQRHRFELAAARHIAQAAGVQRHVMIRADLRPIGGSALTADMPVPKHASTDEIGVTIPPTYVPARNTVFLSLALGWAEVLGAWDIFVGVNAIDYSGYPDCRPEYIVAFERLAQLATKAGVEGRGMYKIHTPLIRMSKADIIRAGVELGVDYVLTHSCYDPDEQGRACGRCDACLLRLRGFDEAGLKDPVPYQFSR